MFQDYSSKENHINNKLKILSMGKEKQWQESKRALILNLFLNWE